MKVREFGRTPEGCVCNVLAVLSDGEESMRATLDAAVELADLTRSRLTLAKTCDRGRSYVWVAPFAVGAAYLPPENDSPQDACRVLSRMADRVPDSIPVTLHVLAEDPQTTVLKLLQERHFGAVVVDKDQLFQWRRVRRRLRRESLRTILVSPAMSRGSILAQFSSSGPSEGGAGDAVQVPEGEGRKRRRRGVRPWSTRRLAGAGGGH